MRAAHRQWASWFWILFVGNDDRGSHLDAAPEKDQEYQVVRIIGKDTFAAGNFLYIGASDLVPEIRKHKDLGVNIVNFISFLIGVSLMWIIKIVLGA